MEDTSGSNWQCVGGQEDEHVDAGLSSFLNLEPFLAPDCDSQFWQNALDSQDINQPTSSSYSTRELIYPFPPQSISGDLQELGHATHQSDGIAGHVNALPGQSPQVLESTSLPYSQPSSFCNQDNLANSMMFGTSCDAPVSDQTPEDNNDPSHRLLTSDAEAGILAPNSMTVFQPDGAPKPKQLPEDRGMALTDHGIIAPRSQAGSRDISSSSDTPPHKKYKLDNLKGNRHIRHIV